MLKKPVKVGVIGAGNMGKNHIRKYAALSESELCAIADPDPAAAVLAKEFGVRFYQDSTEMLDKERPEAVSVVAPTAHHFQIGNEVLKRKIHLLLEKPIASTVAEAKKLIALAKRSGSVFTIGHIEHYNPVILRLKQLIDEGGIGDITSVVCKRVGGFPPVEPKTDVIIDLAVHDIGIINFLLGKYPKAVWSHGSRTLHSHKIDAAKILLDYGDASGFIQANWITPVKIRTIAVTGTAGYVEANYITQQLIHYENNMQRVNDGFETFVKTLGEPKHRLINVDFTEPLENEIKAFLSRVRGGGAKIVEPEEALEALRVALKSAKKYDTPITI
jgi:predicted dehydrogenase